MESDLDDLVDAAGEPAVVIIEIGRRGSLTPERAEAAAQMFCEASYKCPSARLKFCIGGYGNDSRELLDIPEAMQFVRDFSAAVAKHGPAFDAPERLDGDSLAILGFALGIVPRHNIEVYDHQGRRVGHA